MKERVKTGLPGLDNIISGGFPRNSVTLLTGTCGSGKTIFSCQFIYEGLSKYNENAIYMTFEESPESIKENMKCFGMDFSDFERKEKVAFIKYDPYKMDDIIDVLEGEIKRIKAKRVVIDSISAMGIYIRDLAEIRRLIFNLIELLHRLGCTSILISEMLTDQKGLSRFGVEEFLADNVIVLYYNRIDSSYSRFISIWKMRNSDHTTKILPYKMTKKGIRIYPE